jgi:hypothetical protein
MAKLPWPIAEDGGKLPLRLEIAICHATQNPLAPLLLGCGEAFEIRAWGSGAPLSAGLLAPGCEA